MKVTKQMHTSTAHRLDGHPGRCQYLHGHNYLWSVTLEGDELDKGGMLTDFSDLKRAMMEIIDPFDHALVLEDTGDNTVEAAIMQALKTFLFAARVMVVNYRPTAENMAQVVANDLKERFYPQFKVSVILWETATSYAEATA